MKTYKERAEEWTNKFNSRQLSPDEIYAVKRFASYLDQEKTCPHDCPKGSICMKCADNLEMDLKRSQEKPQKECNHLGMGCGQGTSNCKYNSKEPVCEHIDFSKNNGVYCLKCEKVVYQPTPSPVLTPPAQIEELESWENDNVIQNNKINELIKVVNTLSKKL